ncbi:MAG: MarR family transcriptional regulator [Liquorilactobacillus ghanensis]|uniref:MarR family winged helix-turn-helix transcriptional regulator n=1 Tax=Liquorilactobacillus ghanensis TaxID=399370 RepID=UPI0006F014B0|nr:hypothetical protein FD45_GL001158 [Liquorilactobacillus nagelii DSM 13675]
MKKELEYLQAAIQKDLAHALNQSARRINNLLNEELKNYHIYASQYQLLVNIKRYHGESSQKLAQILNIKPAAVSRTLKVLVDKELITRQTATDHRAYQLEITNKGNSLLQELAKRDTTIFANYFGHLTASEVEQLLSLVKKLNY